MTYKAKTITGAQSHARRLENQLARTAKLLSECWKDRMDFAKLAADGPCFHNPLAIYEIKARRDRVLRECCGLKPDGTPIGIKS